jgi:hypothetical protein
VVTDIEDNFPVNFLVVVYHNISETDGFFILLARPDDRIYRVCSASKAAAMVVGALTSLSAVICAAISTHDWTARSKLTHRMSCRS